MPKENRLQTHTQRNKWDVIVDLVNMEEHVFGFNSPEDIESAFVKYSALVHKVASSTVDELQQLAGE